MKVVLGGVLGMLLLSGCVLSQHAYVEPADYDFSGDSAPVSSRAVRFGVFGNYSGSDRRFLVHLGEGRFQCDEYKRWLMIPEMLLKRRLSLFFPVRPDSVHGKLSIDCTIYRFEFDLERKKARFCAEYTLRDGSRVLVLRHEFSAPFRSGSGAALAAAMSRCVALSAKRLSGEVETFSKEGNK